MLERIAGMVFDQPHFYHPRKAEVFLQAFGPRMLGAPVRIANPINDNDLPIAEDANLHVQAGIVGNTFGRVVEGSGRLPFDIIDGVAVIRVEGTLIYKGAYIGKSSGQTSYQGLLVQISMAARIPIVKAVVFEFDTFGGMVNGAFEVAAAIRALSKQKPTIAILTDWSYSAGYLLASQCRQIIVPEFGGTGSIGTIIMHAEFSEFFQKEGVKITIIRSGAHKAKGNPYEELPDDLHERLQSRADVMRDRFAEIVGAGRGKRFTKASALKTEAQAFEADEALNLGLVDAIGDPHQAFDAFVRETNKRRQSA